MQSRGAMNKERNLDCREENGTESERRRANAIQPKRNGRLETKTERRALSLVVPRSTSHEMPGLTFHLKKPVLLQ